MLCHLRSHTSKPRPLFVEWDAYLAVIALDTSISLPSHVTSMGLFERLLEAVIFLGTLHVLRGYSNLSTCLLPSISLPGCMALGVPSQSSLATKTSSTTKSELPYQLLRKQ